ncbi:MAG: hypothetical protein NXI13_07650 [Proteobacteria bacterium]|nr:hypothetical protein [Pseudomonadota bacterium]
MNYEPLNDILRHKDGSIDYSHYTNIGRIERSRQTYKNMGAFSRYLRSVFTFPGKKKSRMKITSQNVMDNTNQKISVRSHSNQKARKAA